MEGGAKVRRWSRVLVEALVVGAGLVVLAGAAFVPLHYFWETDVNLLVQNRLQTGWLAYAMLAGYLFAVGAIFHLLFEAFDWNRLYCVANF